MRDRLLHRLLPLGLALGLLAWLRYGAAVPVRGEGGHGATLALGTLLLGAFVGGQLAKAVRLPRITGYLLTGLILGPKVSALLSADMLLAGKAVDGIATALIALTAGGEIKWAWVRRRWRPLTAITGSTALGVATAAGVTAWFVAPMIDWGLPLSASLRLGLAFLFGAIAVASSPTAALAVIAETRAEGPVARTVLGVTVVKDLVVIIAFAIIVATTRSALGAGGESSLAWTLTRELGGSILAGVLIGQGVALFVTRVGRELPAFLLAVCFGIYELSSTLHLEAMLMALTAGFWVENVSRAEGHDVVKGIERLALPVFALFFAVAGTKVDLGAVATYAVPAALLMGVRAGALWLSNGWGVALGGAEPPVKTWGWMGYISQAGATLALAATAARAFPGWGERLQVLVIAMIAVHEIVGPIAFTFALRRAGEARESTDEAPLPAADQV